MPHGQQMMSAMMCHVAHQGIPRHAHEPPEFKGPHDSGYSGVGATILFIQTIGL